MKHSFTFQGFCGWHSTQAIQTNENASSNIEAMEQALNTSLPTNHFVDARQGCATTSSIASLPEMGYICIIGTPIWKNSHYRRIADEKNHAEALSAAYKEHGSQLCRHIGGPFAFVISDPKSQLFMAATDKLSCFPLYYYPLADGIIFGSTPSAVFAHPLAQQKLREEGIYDYVYFHMVPSPISIYEGLKKLQSSTLLQLKDQQLTLANHWLPRFKEQTSETSQQMSLKLKTSLKNAVSRAMGSEESTGAFLSGGLDSSTVAGMMSELIDGQGEAFSIGFSAEGYDEMEYARITAKHFNVHLNEYYVTPEDVVEALPAIATSYDEPFGNSSALPAYFCAKFAKENGIKRLLAGDGGDELFAGNERYAKQSIFETYQHIPSAFREKILEPIISSLGNKIPLASKAKSFIEQANTPLPDRLQSYNFLHRHEATEIFSTAFIEHINQASPLKLQREIYNRPTDATKLNRMLYLDWQLTLADNDLRKVSHMCALAGIEVVYPMLDDELIEFSTTIPSRWKLRGNKLRHFYKQSLTGWLPNETIHKKKQGFGLPFGVWMQTHKPLQEMAYDNLTALKNRQYFNNQFIDQLINLHKKGHAAYYGELIWILTVLELWMNGHDQ